MTNSFEGITGKVALVDPVSPEVNRGSFCYLSYLLYAAMKKTAPDVEVELLEEFAVADFDDIDWDSFDHICVALWSYPQIESCLMLHKFLKGRVRFYGYYPLIASLGLEAILPGDEVLKIGMESYPEFYGDFNYLLLSDCDKHLVDDSKRAGSQISEKVYPMFTSYGCPNGCKFCPATVNCNRVRVELPHDRVYEMLDYCHQRGYLNIHFTDEDFFYDTARAAGILEHAAKLGRFRFIALGSVQKVLRFIEYMDKYCGPTEQEAIWKTLSLIEIGLETAEPALAKAMGKRGPVTQKDPFLVAEKCKAPILWLTMTFYPGDTVYSINQTGEFLRQYGLSPLQLVDRIVTNGTEGGLGQFFQFYHGTGMSKMDGEVLTYRPMRLIPSYIPNSFLDSKFVVDTGLLDAMMNEVKFWMDVYGICEPVVWKRVVEQIGKFKEAAFTVRNIVGKFEAYVPYANDCIFIAVLARLGIIKAHFE